MKYIIDRFEGTYAVCEDEMKNMVNIPKYKLPMEVKEGDSLIDDDGIIRINDKEADERRKKVNQMMSKLFK
ncbi:DUF3006 domain-containing protein [Lachnoclostridium phytofermentans]|uniref:DUF3006 domain-containing protein n=1 Tax=Lachnoclostridium phytofermentans (strain ATCC 700394 / DSM 18823 / ISDg) TaxID=357809 RepID=A9KIP0_LACP7|nr:DUF3006 domain-containing protein [Lachnoclostridium phytofermentans]ABX43903.1 conserved hypothetical protein [Lachnoclostridium phytofermentans ISDg]